MTSNNIKKGTLLKAKCILHSSKVKNNIQRNEGVLIKKNQIVMFLDGPLCIPGIPKILQYVTVLHKDSLCVIELSKKHEYKTGWGSKPCSIYDLFEIAS